MTDNTLTPDWPHGYEMVDASGATYPFNVKAWDWPGAYPIIGHLHNESYAWRFAADGTKESGAGTLLRLRNAPAPKPQPREWWVNLWRDSLPTAHDREIGALAYRDGRSEAVHSYSSERGRNTMVWVSRSSSKAYCTT